MKEESPSSIGPDGPWAAAASPQRRASHLVETVLSDSESEFSQHHHEPQANVTQTSSSPTMGQHHHELQADAKTSSSAMDVQSNSNDNVFDFLFQAAEMDIEAMEKGVANINDDSVNREAATASNLHGNTFNVPSSDSLASKHPRLPLPPPRDQTTQFDISLQREIEGSNNGIEPPVLAATTPDLSIIGVENRSVSSDSDPGQAPYVSFPTHDDAHDPSMLMPITIAPYDSHPLESGGDAEEDGYKILPEPRKKSRNMRTRETATVSAAVPAAVPAGAIKSFHPNHLESDGKRGDTANGIPAASSPTMQDVQSDVAECRDGLQKEKVAPLRTGHPEVEEDTNVDRQDARPESADTDSKWDERVSGHEQTELPSSKKKKIFCFIFVAHLVLAAAVLLRLSSTGRLGNGGDESLSRGTPAPTVAFQYASPTESPSSLLAPYPIPSTPSVGSKSCFETKNELQDALTNYFNQGETHELMQTYGWIGDWCVSKITDFSGLFIGQETFNAPIENWDTSSATTMREMFRGAKTFNRNIDNWNTSQVTDMYRMFRDASSFNHTLSSWDTSNVLSMYAMVSFTIATDNLTNRCTKHIRPTLTKSSMVRQPSWVN